MSTGERLSRPPRILICSDQDGGLRDLESFLGRHGYFVLRVYAGAPVFEQARAVRPDVIVLDAKLADRQSVDLSRTLRDDPVIGPSVPMLLLVTGQPTPKDHLTALRAGIWELLPRPLNLNELRLKLDGYVHAKVEGERAPKQDLVDDVTGLYAAAGLMRRARELLLQASQHNTSAACVVLAPEPQPGPAATGGGGLPIAEPVQRVAQVLKATGRRSDGIGRVRSVEFAVVAPGTDAGGAVKLAERLRRAVQGGGAAPAGPAFELRAGYAAVGNVRYTPVEPQRLLARAARALQLAKAEGKWIRESSESS